MKFGTALTLSILVHVALAVGIGFYVTYTPPVTLAQLDVTSVELSLAEEDAADTPPLPSLRGSLSDPWQSRDAPHPPERLPLPSMNEALPDLPPPTPAAAPLPEPQPVAPKQARITVDKPPSPKKTIRPDYPKESRQKGEEGNVVVEIRVNTKGVVESARVVTSSGFSRLDDAALRAARAARFTPAQCDGNPVSSTARLTLTFKLTSSIWVPVLHP